MKYCTTLGLLKQLYTACREKDAERTLLACESLTALGVSYRVQNRVLALAYSSNSIEYVYSNLEHILITEELSTISLN
jgi:hypothetical protein